MERADGMNHRASIHSLVFPASEMVLRVMGFVYVSPVPRGFRRCVHGFSFAPTHSASSRILAIPYNYTHCNGYTSNPGSPNQSSPRDPAAKNRARTHNFDASHLIASAADRTTHCAVDQELERERIAHLVRIASA